MTHLNEGVQPPGIHGKDQYGESPPVPDALGSGTEDSSGKSGRRIVRGRSWKYWINHTVFNINCNL